jgi:hypothetical protein
VGGEIMPNLYLFSSDRNSIPLPPGTRFRIAADPPGAFADSAGTPCGVFQTLEPVDGFEVVPDEQIDALGDIKGWNVPYDTIPEPPEPLPIDGLDAALKETAAKFGVSLDEAVMQAVSVVKDTRIKPAPIGVGLKVGG